MANKVRALFPFFSDAEGNPLDGGRVFIGVSGLNPLSNPLQSYWDEALTIPAYGIRTMGGYIVNNGKPSNIYVQNNYSILVQDKNEKTLYSDFNMSIEYPEYLLTTPRGSFFRSMRTPDSFDINLIIESGFYSWSNSGTVHYPSECAASDLFCLMVMASPDGSGTIIQRLLDITLNSDSLVYQYARSSLDGGITWSSWATYGNGWRGALLADLGYHRVELLNGSEKINTKKIFKSSGSFTVPPGVTSILVTGCAAGGNGSNGNAGTVCGAGGGGSEVAYKVPLTVSPGDVIDITIPIAGSQADAILKKGSTTIFLLNHGQPGNNDNGGPGGALGYGSRRGGNGGRGYNYNGGSPLAGANGEDCLLAKGGGVGWNAPATQAGGGGASLGCLGGHLLATVGAGINNAAPGDFGGGGSGASSFFAPNGNGGNGGYGGGGGGAGSVNGTGCVPGIGGPGIIILEWEY